MFRLIIIFQSINNWQWTFWWMLFFLNTRVISNCYVILFFTLLRKKANEKERLLSFYLLVSKVNKLNQTCFSTFFFFFQAMLKTALIRYGAFHVRCRMFWFYSSHAGFRRLYRYRVYIPKTDCAMFVWAFTDDCVQNNRSRINVVTSRAVLCLSMLHLVVFMR